MGHYTTQKFESVHHDFKSSLADYHVMAENHPQFGQTLKKATVSYNGSKEDWKVSPKNNSH